MIIICSPHRRHADARAHQLALCRLETSKNEPKRKTHKTTVPWSFLLLWEHKKGPNVPVYLGHVRTDSQKLKLESQN